MSGPAIRGRFLWHELLTTDLTGATRFYTGIMGWKAQAWEQNPEYPMFVGSRGPVAGYLPLPEAARAMGAPPGWLSYIGTTDLDATLRLALELGAHALTEVQSMENVGRSLTLRDPQGAVFAIFQPVGPPPHDTPALGEFAWHELVTHDPSAAWTFYSRLFGWEKTESMDMGAMGVYQLYGWGKTSIGGMYHKPPDMPAPSHWLPYVSVPDAKRVAAAVPKAGGTVMHGPAEVPGGSWIVMGGDPQGGGFAVVAMPATMPEAKPATPATGKPAAKQQAAPKQAAAKKKSTPKKKAAKKQAAPKKKAAKKRAAPKKKAAKKKVARKKGAAKRTSAPKKAAKKKAAAKRKAAPKKRARRR